MLPLSLAAQSSAFWGQTASRDAAMVPAIRLVKKAEVLVAKVTIAASNSHAEEQAAAFMAALQSLRAEVSRNADMSIKEERTVFGGGESGYYLSSAKFDAKQSAAHILLVHSLRPGVDSPAAAQVLRNLVSQLKLPRDVAVRIETISLEVRDVASLRESLLQAIATDVARLRAIFQETSIQLGGLEKAIEQRALNDSEIAIYIPYSLTLGASKR
ncbi:MAG: hypothetical protein HZA31_11085 [Opitutae bacterium]|nr:hypothetical protein [Opitutae bacterium]